MEGTVSTYAEGETASRGMIVLRAFVALNAACIALVTGAILVVDAWVPALYFAGSCFVTWWCVRGIERS